jgi:hypothetical protein
MHPGRSPVGGKPIIARFDGGFVPSDARGQGRWVQQGSIRQGHFLVRLGLPGAAECVVQAERMCVAQAGR